MSHFVFNQIIKMFGGYENAARVGPQDREGPDITIPARSSVKSLNVIKGTDADQVRAGRRLISSAPRKEQQHGEGADHESPPSSPSPGAKVIVTGMQAIR